MDKETKKKGPQFSVDLLFSEPLHFSISEIVEAINQDFPSCRIFDFGANPKENLRTDEPIIGILKPADPLDGGMIRLGCAGVPDEQFRNADHTEALWRSGGFGEEAIAKHQSYLKISVDAVDDTLASTFRAARLLNAVTAVFAKLPITLAVNVLWAHHFFRPHMWVEAGEQAVKGEWPMLAWISYRTGWDGTPGRHSDHSLGYTTGLKCFLPYELHLESAPITPKEVVLMLMAAAWMPLQGGSKLTDGDTIGGDQKGDVRYRIRRRHAADGTPMDVLVLLHPQSPLDEEREFGKRPGIDAPLEDPFISRPQKGFLQSLLGRN